MCVGLSRLKNEMIVCDVGLISGQNLVTAVDRVISFNRQLQISSQDVSDAVSPSLTFFNKYQMSAVGRLSDTTELPESEHSDVESVDRESIHTEPEAEEDEAQETT